MDMLYLAKKKKEQFYVNPEDAKKYSDDGYEIIDIETGHRLSQKKISELKPDIIHSFIAGNVKG